MPAKRRDDGEGTAYQRASDGRWAASVTVGWEAKPGGGQRRIRRTVYGATEAEAKANRRDLLRKRDAGELPTGPTVTVKAWMTYWLDEIAVHRCRPSTLEGYRSKVEQWIVPVIGDVRLAALAPEHVERLQKAMRKGRAREVARKDGSVRTVAAKPMSPASILQTHRILSRALKVAHQRGKVTKNVATLVDSPSVAGRRAEHFLTPEQARAFLERVAGEWNGARWSVGLALGLRQGEALGLLWSSPGVRGVDLDEGVVHVERQLQRRRATVAADGRKVPGKLELVEYAKSSAGRRSIALPGPLVTALREHRQAQRAAQLAFGLGAAPCPLGDLLFWQQTTGAPVDPRQDWQEWRDLLAAIEAPPIRQHAARHTAATLMLMQGVDVKVVSSILGHSSTQITRDLYQHVMPELQRDAADRMGAALWG